MRIAAALGDIELVSLDSMQVYRGMDIGTAKPSAADQAAVPHHLIDVVDPWDSWSAARTQSIAREAVADIEQRGLRALLVGGTGLYLQAVVDHFDFPGEDLELRASLDAEVSTQSGLTAAYARLQGADPVAASRIEPGNARRIVRALEVMQVTGKPFSAQGAGVGAYGETVFPVRIAGMSETSENLAVRIAARFSTMRAAGLVDEVRTLAENPNGWSRAAQQAIGYKEVLSHFAKGGLSLDEAFDLAVRRTRKFARRQRVWFRRDPRIEWFDAKMGDLEAQLMAFWSRP